MFHPIHSASRVGFVDVIREIIKKQPTLINAKDYKRLTPLHHAIAYIFVKIEHKIWNLWIFCLDKMKFLSTRPTNLETLLFTQPSCATTWVMTPFTVDSAEKLVNAKASLDILNNDYLAPVDLGLDSPSLRTKNFLRSVTMKSQKLRQYSSDN